MTISTCTVGKTLEGGGGLVQDIIAAACGYKTGTRGERRKLSKTVAEIEPFSQSAGPAL